MHTCVAQHVWKLSPSSMCILGIELGCQAWCKFLPLLTHLPGPFWKLKSISCHFVCVSVCYVPYHVRVKVRKTTCLSRFSHCVGTWNPTRVVRCGRKHVFAQWLISLTQRRMLPLLGTGRDAHHYTNQEVIDWFFLLVVGSGYVLMSVTVTSPTMRIAGFACI